MPRENFTFETHKSLTDKYVADIYRGEHHVIQSPAFDRATDDHPDQFAKDWAEDWLKRHP